MKISTTRKKSILIYVDDALADQIDVDKFTCRKVYEYEALCFPDYLGWVVIVDSIPKLDVFLSLLDVQDASI